MGGCEVPHYPCLAQTHNTIVMIICNHHKFESKTFDTYLFFYNMKQQILDVLVLIGTSCSLKFRLVLNAFVDKDLQMKITVFRYN